jgi:hypothetical protein
MLFVPRAATRFSSARRVKRAATASGLGSLSQAASALRARSLSSPRFGNGTIRDRIRGQSASPPRPSPTLRTMTRTLPLPLGGRVAAGIEFRQAGREVTLLGLEVVEPLEHAAALRCDLFQECLAAHFGAEGFGPRARPDHSERAVAVGTSLLHVSTRCSGEGSGRDRSHNASRSTSGNPALARARAFLR